MHYVKNTASEIVLSQSKPGTALHAIYQQTQNNPDAQIFPKTKVFEAIAEKILESSENAHFGITSEVNHPDVIFADIKESLISRIAFGLQKNSGKEKQLVYERIIPLCCVILYKYHKNT